jgi:hypothetical protein
LSFEDRRRERHLDATMCGRSCPDPLDFITPFSGNIFDAETGALKGSYSAYVIPAFSSSAGFFLLATGTLQGLELPNNRRR